MIKVGLVITNHSSEKIRPYGRDLLINAYQSFVKNCKYEHHIIVIDNQSDHKLFENDLLKKQPNVHYTYINDQWKRGLTGAWNDGIKQAFDLDCDIILNSNDDLIFNETINNFIKEIDSHSQKNIAIFGPVTNGVNGSFVSVQYAERPNPALSRELLGDGWAGFVSGFFFGFTKNFYQKFKYPDGDLFAEFDKFDKAYIHKYAGDCGKWGGQEMEILRFKENGGKVFVVGECWIDHIKKRDWSKARQIAGEYGWHLTEKF